MTSLTWIMALATLAALFALVAAFRFLFRENRRTLALDRRLLAVRWQAAAAFGESERSLDDVSAIWSYLSLTAVDALRVAAIVVPVGAAERAKLGDLLRQAGFQQNDALAFFLSLKMVLALTVGILAAFLPAWGGHTVLMGFAGLAGAVMGGVLPELALRHLRDRRCRNLARALPDALDLMALCVEAGYTFERALSMVSEELRPLAPELAAELGSAEAQLRLGADRKAVLEDLCERTPAEGLRDFATTVIQGERYGTPMGQSIQNIARNERMQRGARIEAQAGRLPVFMSIPMLLLVVPGILVLVGGPAFMLAINALQGMSAN